jgi:hypothetical protein
MAELSDEIRKKWLARVRTNAALDPALREALEKKITESDGVVGRRELLEALEAVLAEDR